MDASLDHPKIVTPFVPTLLHLASVKMAVPLFREFGTKILDEAYSEIQLGNLKTSERNMAQSRAKEILLYIPAHLGQGVMAAVHGSRNAAEDWMECLPIPFRLKKEELNIQWRSDGSIDSAKTAHNLVQNTKLGSRERFEIACFYCLEEGVKALWAEMVESGETEDFGTSEFLIVHFWVRRMQSQSQVPWTESLIQAIKTMSRKFTDRSSFPGFQVPIFSVFFPLLQPEERQRCSPFLLNADLDDLRFCLYSLTKEEEERMLLKNWFAFRLLSLYLRWPLQTLFFETAQKLWNYIDEDCYCLLLSNILDLNRSSKDFDYSELFEKFWNSSPVHLREIAREDPEDPELVEEIESFFADKRRRENI